jgi:uncharacterized protein (DUF362 family)
MTKGVSIKFKSYGETVPKLLELIKFEKVLQQHNKIVLKPHLESDVSKNTPAEFLEAILKFSMPKKSPETEIFIAEGADGANTMDLFEQNGYDKLSEQYSVGLIDFNTSEVEEILDGEFLKFERILYPKILSESFVISIPKLCEDEESEIQSSLSIMVGAFPAKHYAGFFSNKKSKIRKWPLKFSVHDILKCKMPQFAIIDASIKGTILAGVPLEMDKQAARLMEKDWKSVGYLRLMSESVMNSLKKEEERKKAREEKKKQADSKVY